MELTDTSKGSTATTTYWQKDDKWQWKHVAAKADGKNLQGTGTLLFEDGGKTMIGDGTLYLDDEELPHYHDVYKRVGK